MKSPTAHPLADAPEATPDREAKSLRDLSPQQWKTGIAAWFGWLFDGLDMHLYGLVAAPFVAYLLSVSDVAHPDVKEKSSWIQAAFLVGWALGGGFFGRLGDKIGRSRALSLTILTYAIFTGLSFFAQTWWQLLIFRFISALGIGGEWAVGSSLLSETWPKRWRPWIAAVLQTGVNLGVLLACLTTYMMAGLHSKWVFVVGVLPALMVFWIRRHVPEPKEWTAAKARATGREPGIVDLFRGKVLRTTILTIIVCACGLTAWWSFMFWHPHHLRNLPDLDAAKRAAYQAALAAGTFGANIPELAAWVAAEKQRVVSTAFSLIILSSIFGNFFAGWMAQRFGYRRTIALSYAGFIVTIALTFGQPRGWESLLWIWLPSIGFCSGVFGLFTMYLPPLFPTLLRTTGAGFCYNIGRIASAAGVVFFGLFSKVGDFRTALLYGAYVFVPATIVALLLPEPGDGKSTDEQANP